jgi:hypothetical protein
MLKKIFLMVVLTILFCTSASAEDTANIRLLVDGQEINTGAKPQIINGVLMVPASDVSAALGVEIIYDETNNTVNIEREGEYEFLQQLAELMDKDPGVVNLINDVLSNYSAGYSNPDLESPVYNNEEPTSDISEIDQQPPQDSWPESIEPESLSEQEPKPENITIDSESTYY